MTHVNALSTASTSLMPQKALPYWHLATSPNTRKAYQSDIRAFIEAGGLLPTSTEALLHYLNQQATLLAPQTLKRRLVALKQWHTTQAFPDPTTHPLIKKTLRGIARTHGEPAQKAPVLSVEQLLLLSSKLMVEDSLTAVRDNALLQIGFFGAFRRSELVSIKWEHVTFVPEGVEISIPRSKTDAEGVGQTCAIPYGQWPLCPVTALQRWQTRSALTEGAVFRAIRHNKCNLKQGLSPATVNRIIKQRAIESELPHAENYSGHSLRRGFATSASQKGATLGAIMRQGRWHHEATVYGYIEAGKRFEANAAGAILDTMASVPLSTLSEGIAHG